MSLTILERQFVDWWKKQDFSGWKEPDIREDFIAPLLGVLGYAKGTVAGILREQTFKLSEPYHRIGRDSIKIDYIPTLRMKGFWIMEAKPGDPKQIEPGDFLQAHFYAIHPEVKALLIVLANGWSVSVYDALTISSWDRPLVDCTRETCEQTFETLRDLVGARSMLDKQRSRLLFHVANSFAVEIDGRDVASFIRNMQQLAQSIEPAVRENARKFQMAAFREEQERERKRFETESIDTLLHVDMDIPTDIRPIPAEGVAKRILFLEQGERCKALQQLVSNCWSRRHCLFRVNTLYVLLRVFDSKATVTDLNLKRDIQYLASANANYWKEHPLVNALCHLDNAALRLGKKIAKRGAMEIVSAAVKKMKTELPPDDLLRLNPTVAGVMTGFVGLMAEGLWRQYCSRSDPAQIWEGIWSYEDIEKQLDDFAPVPYPRGEFDLLNLEYYGNGFDVLRLGTWDVLNRFGVSSRPAEFSDDIVALAALKREEVMSSIPRARTKPDGWKARRVTLPPLTQSLLAGIINS